jgi:hypothetical protein
MSSLDTLLAELAGAPVLPGRKCRGWPHLFHVATPGEDPDTVHYRHTQALGLCARCPSIDRCRTWLDGLPPRQRPTGIIAGQIHTPQ